MAQSKCFLCRKQVILEKMGKRSFTRGVRLKYCVLTGRYKDKCTSLEEFRKTIEVD